MEGETLPLVGLEQPHVLEIHRPLFKEMARFLLNGHRITILEGNHDAASRISRSLPLPGNVKTFPTEAPGTFHAVEGRAAALGRCCKQLLALFERQ